MDSTSGNPGKKRASQIEDDPAATDEERDLSSSAKSHAARLRSIFLDESPLKGVKYPTRVRQSKQRSPANAKAQLKRNRGHSADLRGWSPYIAREFVNAVKNGDSEMVKSLLEAGADANQQEEEIGSVLADRCYHEDLITAGLLIDAGAHIDLQLELGPYGSALAAACWVGNETSVGFLVKRGANVNMQLENGRYGSALAAASCSDRIMIMWILLSKGASVNLQLKYGMFGSALAAASYSGNLLMAEALLTKGAIVNLQLEYGLFGSALAAAIASADFGLIQFLLQRGADASLPLCRGQFGDAFSRAVDMGNIDIIIKLLQAGASIGPLAEVALKKAARRSTLLSDNISRRGVDINQYDEEPAQQTFEWLPPTTMSDKQDNTTRLSEFGILIKHHDVVEFDALHNFIERTYGLLGSKVLLGLARAASPEHRYGKFFHKSL